MRGWRVGYWVWGEGERGGRGGGVSAGHEWESGSEGGGGEEGEEEEEVEGEDGEEVGAFFLRDTKRSHPLGFVCWSSVVSLSLLSSACNDAKAPKLTS